MITGRGVIGSVRNKCPEETFSRRTFFEDVSQDAFASRFERLNAKKWAKNNFRN